MRKSLLGFAIGIASLTALVAFPVQAKDYPDKPVRLVVPFPPGGVVDVIARVLAPKLSEVLAGHFYIEDLAGAGGELGTARAAAAAADGSTVLFTAPDFLTVPALKAKTSYDPIASFTPVTLAATAPGLISVNASLPVTSMSELFALLKANPGKYSYATPGYGTLPHLEAEQMFRLSRGLDVVHVPFQGFGPAITSTIAGHTSIVMGGSPSIIAPHAKEETAAAYDLNQSALSGLADVPTREEAGVPDWGGGFWGGIMVPAGTPKEIVTRLHREIAPDHAAAGCQGTASCTWASSPVGSPPDEFAAWLKTEYAKWREVVRKANLTIE